MSLACMQDDLLGPSWQLWQWMVTVIAPKDSESYRVLLDTWEYVKKVE